VIGGPARVTTFKVLCGGVLWYRISRLIAKEPDISIDDPHFGAGQQRYGMPA
jgi:hypothetical protein